MGPQRRRDKWAGNRLVSRELIDLTAGRSSDQLGSEPQLLELAQRHGLIGLLVDQDESSLVRAVHSRNVARTAVIQKHGRRLLERLHAAGLRAALLKGPRLSSNYYSNPDHRSFSDLDFLVDEGDVPQVLDVLATDEAVYQIPSKRPKSDKRDVPVHDESGMTFNLDLHWNLFSYTQLRGTADMAMRDLWREATPNLDSPLGPHWVLPFGFELCFLGAHAILDHRFRMVLFRDFLEISNHSVDWDAVLRTANRYRLRSVAYIPLWIAHEAIGAGVPAEFLAELRPSSFPVQYLERALPRTDLVTFDGRTVHPINLASVLLNDSAATRLRLASRAPFAFRGWQRRVAEGLESPDSSRALIVVATDRRRGAEVFAERLEKGMLRRGLFAEAISLTTSDAPSKASVHPITDLDRQQVRKLDRRIVLALRSKIREIGPRVVIASGPTLRYSLMATVGLGVKVAYLAIGEPSFWIRSKWKKAVHRAALRRVDRVLAVSEATRHQLLELEPTLSGRIDVVFTGVETVSVTSPPRHFTSKPLKILFVGALTPEKDPLAAARAVAQVDGCRLRFVGDGQLAEALQELSSELAITDRVEMVGPVDDVGPHFDWAHVLILPSMTEGLPGVVLEGGMAGVPTVAYDVGGVNEAVIDGVSGLLVRPRDVKSLALALQQLRDDRNHLAALGIAARKYVEETFEFEKILDGYIVSLHSALAQP